MKHVKMTELCMNDLETTLYVGTRCVEKKKIYKSI